MLDDPSRLLVARKLCSSMEAEYVPATLDLALTASGLDRMNVRHRPILLSGNGFRGMAGDLAEGWKARA